MREPRPLPPSPVLANGTEYDVRVATRNLIGMGTYTSKESATPNVRVAAPANITTTPGTDNHSG